MSITDEHFQKGIDAYQREDYKSAEAEFLKVLEYEPYASEALLNLGNVYFKKNRLDEAEVRWLKAIEYNPMEEKAYLNLGNLYFSANDYNKAIYYWEIFQNLRPSQANVYLNLGLAYEQVGKLPEAFRNYKGFLRSKTAGAEGIYLKGRMDTADKIATHNLIQAQKFMKSGQLKNAKEAFKQSVSLIPLHAKVYKHYATVLYQLGEYTEAMTWYEKAHIGIPEDSGILINLGVTYDKLGDLFGALWAYNTAVEMDSWNIPGKIKQRREELWQQLGVAELEKHHEKVKQDIEKRKYIEAEELAQRIYSIAKSLAPQKAETYEKQIDFLEDRKDPQKMAADIAYSLGEDFRSQGQYEKSLKCYERYLKLQPNGDKVKEIKEKQEQIQQVISAVVGTMLTEEKPPQNVA